MKTEGINKSMVDVAYDVVSSHSEPILFSELFSGVCEILELTEEEKRDSIARFYTNLSLDGRFVDLRDNYWDLRERQKYDKVHIDMNDVYSDIEEEVAGNMDVEELDEHEKAETGLGDNEEDGIDGITDEEASARDE